MIDAGWISLAITILLSLLGLAVWLGALHERVNNLRTGVAIMKKDADNALKENREEHQLIISKIDGLTKVLLNRDKDGN